MSALVSPEWLQERLGHPAVRVIESSIEKATYDAAHIPGALWCDHFRDLLQSGDDTQGDILNPGQFAALMSRYGVTPDTRVVWYGDRHNAFATRGFWTMDFYKHPAPFHVLDGGRERWLAEGRPTTSEVVAPPKTLYPQPWDFTAEDRATWRHVRDAITDPAKVILDVRSQEEYDGTVARAKRGGHIPGAVHVEWTDATAAPNVLKPLDELRRLYEDAGITPDKEVIAHCQLGVRASHTWFVLKHVLGYPNVRNYDGSWAEWGNRDDLPIEK